MTQKSAARRLRDHQAEQQLKKAREANAGGSETFAANEPIPPNSCLDDLHNLYNECAGLLGMHAHLHTLAGSQDLIACVEDKQRLIDNLRLLKTDLVQLSKELLEIYSYHSHRSGPTTDENVVIWAFEVSERYQLFMQRHEEIIMPTAAAVTEQLHKAEVKLAAIVAAEKQRLQEERVAAGLETPPATEETQQPHPVLESQQ